MTAQNGTTNPFTAEQHSLIKQMVADGKSWTKIGDVCGHSPNSCSTTYHARKNQIAKKGTPMPWCAEEMVRLKYLRDVQHKSYQDIGRELGRTAASCNTKHNVLTEGSVPQHGQIQQGMRVPVTAAALADRDQRYQLRMQQCPIAALLGEPLPGRSALDQRNRSQAEPA
jgi:hypothetical protein